jgi:hypothetical protein
VIVAKKWIKSAVEGGKGKFAAKAKAAGETTREYAREKANAPGTLGKEARLAQTLMGLHERRGSVLYDRKNKD